MTQDTVTEPRKETRGATCSVCGEYSEMDDDRTGPRSGKFFCENCADGTDEYVAECLDCQWEYRKEAPAHQGYHTRVRVQQEGSSHESEMKTFHDETHETVWRKAAGD